MLKEIEIKHGMYRLTIKKTSNKLLFTIKDSTNESMFFALRPENIKFLITMLQLWHEEFVDDSEEFNL